MSTHKPTISDVASAAGVSKGLVSFALNDRPGVAPATRERILAVASDLGWRPSVTARSLSTRTSFALGLVIRRAAEVISADPFFPSFIAGVESVLSEEGRALVLSVVPDEAAELRAYRTLAADNRVDGVFLTDLRHDDKRFVLLDELGLPGVALGHPTHGGGFPFVELDDASGIQAAVEHLVLLGHTRIGHVAGDPAMIHGGRRSASFSGAMRAAGLDPSLVVETNFSVAHGADATRHLLDAGHPPTAIVYANDPMAIAGLGVAQQRGLTVPDDLSITGFDGTDISAYVYPALTTITSDPVEWGRVAARTLLHRIATGAASNVALPPARLLVRESTAPTATRGTVAAPR